MDATVGSAGSRASLSAVDTKRHKRGGLGHYASERPSKGGEDNGGKKGGGKYGGKNSGGKKRVASLTVVGSLVAKEKMAKDHLDSKVKDKDPLKAAGHVEAHAFRINALRTVETKASQKVVLDHYADYRRFQCRRFQWKVIYSMYFEGLGQNMLRTFPKL